MKRSGAVFEAGSILARLDLDDPSRVHRAELYTSSFEALEVEVDSVSEHSDSGATSSASTIEPHMMPGEHKLNTTFMQAKTFLENILAGFVLPEPYFSNFMSNYVETFMDCLRDPRLPLLELQDIIASTSGRIPAQVEKSIRKLLNNYSSNITAILAAFPSQQIASVIDSYAATLQKRADRDVFFLNTQGIVQLVQRYRNGKSF